MEAQGVEWPARKETLIKTWSKTGDVAKRMGRAVSGLYTNLLNPAKDDKSVTGYWLRLVEVT